ncbi:hypothetical protein B0J14DRAFT_358797, partial [Halenospora varia]
FLIFWKKGKKQRWRPEPVNIFFFGFLDFRKATLGAEAGVVFFLWFLVVLFVNPDTSVAPAAPVAAASTLSATDLWSWEEAAEVMVEGSQRESDPPRWRPIPKRNRIGSGSPVFGVGPDTNALWKNLHNERTSQMWWFGSWRRSVHSEMVQVHPLL